jgi:hypothetical protein
MIDRIPPSRPTPPQIPVTPKQAGKEEGKRVEQQPQQRQGGSSASLPLDSHAISVRLAALAVEAREKELSMGKIIEKAIAETGMTNPQAAMEEVDKLLQKEIDAVLNDIKNNKELMEEAEAWQALGDLLESNLTKDQVEAFIDLVKSQIESMK